MSPKLRLILSFCLFVLMSLKATAQLQIQSVDIKDVSCHGGNDGQITINITGGTPPFEYTIIRLNPSPIRMDVIASTDRTVTFPGILPIVAGSYFVIVDDGAVSANAIVSVSQPITLTAGITPDPAQACSGSNIQLNGNPSGGTGIYTHLWTGPGAAHLNSTNIANPVFNSATGGNFNLTYTVTDANNCTATDNITIVNTANPVTSAGTGGTACGMSFTFNATQSFGTGTWTYTGPGTATFSNVNNPTATVTVSVAGSYTFTWTEINVGCSDSDDVVVTFVPQPTLSLTPVDPSAPGSTDGSILATVSGGTGPFNYILTDPFNNQTPSGPTGSTSFLFSNLGGGNYTVETVDANNCRDTRATTLSASPILTVNVQTSPACTGNDGSIGINITSGQPPFTITVTQVPGGVVFNTTSSSTNHTIPALAAGNYDISIQDGALNNFATSVTVNPGATASISYIGSPFCGGSGIATVTRTGQSGGTYTAVPSGLVIDPNTGTINLATSSSGTYTVTYNFTDGVCSGSTQTTVEIGALGAVTISYDNNPYCAVGTATVTITGLPMDYTEATYTAGHIQTDGLFDLNQNFSRCPGQLVVNIPFGAVITGVDVQYNMRAHGSPLSYIADQRSQLRVVSPGGISEPEVTRGPAGSLTQGIQTYVRTGLNIANGVVGGGNIVFELHAGRTWSGPAGTSCLTNRQRVENNTWRVRVYHTAVNNFYALPAGLVIDPITGEVDLEASTPGTYTVYFEFGDGTCTGIATTQITVIARPVATIQYEDSPYCAVGTATVTRTGQAGGIYSSTAGLVIDPATGTINLETSNPGNYTVTYTFTNPDGTCENSTTTQVVINALPQATITYPGSPFCATGIANVTLTGQTGGDFTSIPAGLSLNPVTGAINLGASTPGIYTVTYTFSDGTCDNLTTTQVEVRAIPTASISYDDVPYCAFGIATVTLLGQPGGTFSSTTGLIIDANTGDINLTASQPGTYTVTYSFSDGTCSSSTSSLITINPLPQATISYLGSPFCATGTALVTRIGQAGGTYISTAGLVINPVTGEIDLASSIPGTYTVTYEFTDGICDNITSTTVTINAIPTATISYPGSPFCAMGTVNVVITGQLGGTFASTAGLSLNASTGQINLEASTPGTYTVTYTFNNGSCTNTTTTTVTINALPVATISYPLSPYCPVGIASVTRTGQVGGTYSSTSGLVINPVTGEINLATSTPGTYTVTYAFTDGICNNITTTQITIRQLPVATISYPGTPYCATSVANVTLTGQTGGTFSSQPGLSIDPVTGLVNLESSAPGTYVVTYTFSDGFCLNTTTANITVLALPVATISYDEAYYCAFGFAEVTLTGQIGGTFSSTTGLVIDPVTGEVNLELSLSGTYTVTYTFSDGTCTASTTAQITLRALPQAQIVYDGSPFCGGGTATTTITGQTGGIFNAYPVGLSLGLTTGTIDLNNSIPGTYTVYYRFDDGFCENITTTTVVINEAPLLLLDNFTDALCAGDVSGTITVQAIGGLLPYTYELLDADQVTVLQSSASNDTDPFTFANVPHGLFFLRVTDGNNCSSTVIGPVFIDHPDSIAIDPASVMISPVSCAGLNNGSISIAAQGGTGNLHFTLLSNGIVIAGPQTNNGIFDNLAPGLYVISITDDANCGPVLSDEYRIPDAIPLVFSFISDDSLCSGDQANIEVSVTGGADPYQISLWFEGVLVQGPFMANDGEMVTFVGVNQIGNYLITANDACGNVEITHTIVVYPSPVVDLGGDIEACEGTPIILDAGALADVSYLWSDGSTSQTLEINLSGTYSVIVTNNSTLCSTEDVIEVIINPSPTALTGDDQTICLGNAVTLGAEIFVPVPANTYLWTSNPEDLSLINPDISNPTVSPLVTTVYTLTETYTGTGCSTINSVTITVIGSTPNAGEDQAICAGTEIVLGPENPIEGNIFTWTSSNPEEVFETNVPNPVVTPLVTTTYTLVEEYAGYGCSNTASITITVNPLPLAETGPNHDICIGDIITLGAQMGGGSIPLHTYLWSSEPPDASMSDPSISTITVSPSQTTTYTLVETNISTGCTAQRSVVVTVHDFPSAFVINNESLCENTEITLGADSASVVFNYMWSSEPAGFSSTDKNPLVVPSDYTLDENNEITFFLEVRSQYCTSRNQVTLTIIPAPEVRIADDTGFCSADEAQNLLLGGDAIPGYSYLWESDANDGFSSTVANPVVSPMATTTYTVIVIDTINGCAASDSVTISISDLAFISLQNPVICEGDTMAALGENIVVIGGMEPYQYFWTDADGISVANILNPIINTPFSLHYNLSVTDALNCPISGQVQVTITESPEVYLAVNNDTIRGNLGIYIGQSITFQALPDTYQHYDFYIIDAPVEGETGEPGPVVGRLVQSGPSNLFTTSDLINGQVYYVVAFDGRCYGESEMVTLIVNELPNAFTPDGDGINDIFAEGLEITVFNRWGQKVYQGARGSAGWDGSYNGRKVSPGTYFYVLNIYDEDNRKTTHKGSVTVILNEIIRR